MEMKFTYQAYRELLSLLKEKGYANATYDDWQQYDRCAILRHDIDTDLEKAVCFAELEQECGVSSTYFVLVTSDLYNVFSARSAKAIHRIMECGHEIGLHFDEVRYPDAAHPEELTKLIMKEAELLSYVTGFPVTCVSMHRPSRRTLEADLKIPDMVNSYGQTFFRDFKYVSDSRMHWREPVLDYIQQEKYERLHILTHAVWYQEQEMPLREVLLSYLSGAGARLWDILNENLTDLSSIIRKEEIQ